MSISHFSKCPGKIFEVISPPKSVYYQSTKWCSTNWHWSFIIQNSKYRKRIKKARSQTWIGRKDYFKCWIFTGWYWYRLLDHTRWRSRHIDEYDSVLLNTIKSVLFLPILIVLLSEHQFFSMRAVGRIRFYLEKWNRPVEHKPGNSWLQKKLIF